MEMLRTRKNQVVDASGNQVLLRGPSLGGWMNLENFINGYPGIEASLRHTFKTIAGPEKTEFYFQRMRQHFFTEEDVAFIKKCGSTFIRLPLNYRHFEEDLEPFRYIEKGFEPLDEVLGWCEKYGLYAVLDLHAVQGWQNSDWPSDNCGRQSLLWVHRHFQDRCVEMWKQLAGRYKGRAVVAGYDLINEPLSGMPYGRLKTFNLPSNWPVLNGLYRRLVTEIRKIDPDHIIFIEGDNFSKQFDGMDPPFAENIVYSGHHYNRAGFGPGVYPGTIMDVSWDLAKQEEVYLAHEGVKYSREHDVPYWVGEFGAVYSVPPHEIDSRLKAVDDQISVFNKYGSHWAIWTYKDMGVMGWFTVDKESDFVQTLDHILKAKKELHVDFWGGWITDTKTHSYFEQLARHTMEVIDDPDIDFHNHKKFLMQAALSGYIALRMQPAMAKMIKQMSEEKIDDMLSSFRTEKCVMNKRLVDLVSRRMER